MGYHIIAFFTGFLLDMVLGDPCFLPHPVRLIGSLITKTEKYFREKYLRNSGSGQNRNARAGQTQPERNAEKELRLGIWLVVIVTFAAPVTAALVLLLAYLLHPLAGIVAEAVMTYQILAAKCLKVESMKVYRCLKCSDLQGARKAVSMIVGRDTECLDGEGIARAAIETVAENTSDGVIAPMLYTAVGGPVLGFWYKAVNTLDSMVGYKNEKYLYFGRAAARLDDGANYIPARISAYLMILAACIGGKRFSGKGALAIYRRDNRKHASPNSAQTESVCAGALGIRLAGDASYFGKVVKKPYIGEALRNVEFEDIRFANRLMYLTAWLGEIVCLLLMVLVWRFFAGI